MTITYGGNFLKCVLRWKGSVWKAIWKELTVWLFCYIILHLILSYAMPGYKEKIHLIIKLFDEYTRKMPVEFLLGFYVGQIVKRWWEQVKTVPWPDDVISMVNIYFFENDEIIRNKRKKVGRYVLLSIILAMRNVSTHLKKKLPSYQNFLECGLMTQKEWDKLMKTPFDRMHWELPLQWVQEIVRSKVGFQVDQIPPTALAPIVQELNKVRASLRMLTTYDWIVIPLVYTQTVTVAVYGYFLFSFLGHQFSGIDNVDFFVTFLTVLQFIFYLGWLKVAEYLHKPFGDDDDDVDLSIWLERHVRATFLLTDYTLTQPADITIREESNVDIVSSMFYKKSTETSNLLGIKK